MKKVLFGMVALALAMSAQAVNSLTVKIKTEAPGAPEITSTESVSGYTCYVLSGTKMAKAMGIESIGATEVGRVTEWLSANFADNYASVMAQSPTKMDKMFNMGALDFHNSSLSSFDNRFGVVTYAVEEDAITQFRVFNFNNNQNIQDFTTGSGVWADWTAAPEPTSGLLLLLGVAGLALKRKRA